MSSIAMPVLADAASVAAKVNSLTGGASTTDDGVFLDLPEIAENGNAVKVAFEIDSPMTSDNFVKTVHVMADGNPTPDVASFNFHLRMVSAWPPHACVWPKPRTSSFWLK